MATFYTNEQRGPYLTMPTGYHPPTVSYTVNYSSPPLRGRKLLAFMRKNAWRINRRKRP